MEASDRLLRSKQGRDSSCSKFDKTVVNSNQYRGCEVKSHTWKNRQGKPERGRKLAVRISNVSLD